MQLDNFRSRTPETINFWTPYPPSAGNFPVFSYEFTMDTERDLAYMRQLYPAFMQMIYQEVEKALDALDYIGSPLYDEYPDQEWFLRTVSRIYSSLLTSGILHPDACPSVPAENMTAAQSSAAMLQADPCFYLIMLFVHHEMLQRRRRHRSRRKW